jgi:CRP-like cAMP-binding protein
MAGDPSSLQSVLEQHSERISKPKSSVLFRLGEKASGMFVILSGRVKLDFGVASADCTYGPGALVGLPSTITRRNSSVTATVTEDAELGFLSPERLDSLLHQRPELCEKLLVILGERFTDNHRFVHALLKQAA